MDNNYQYNINILWISFSGSWTLPLLSNIRKINKGRISIIKPTFNKNEEEGKIIKDGIEYYTIFFSHKELLSSMTKSTFQKFNTIITRTAPDIIHIHGTEKNLAQIQNFVTHIPVVISIQGILSACKNYVYNYLNKNELLSCASVKNLLGWGGVKYMERIIKKSQNFEENIFSNGQYFIGRTMWDRAQIIFRNPKAKYYVGEELLRNEFYEFQNSWSQQHCIPYRLFMPAGINPMKGLHLAIKAVILLKKFYPNIQLIVPGIPSKFSSNNSLRIKLLGEEYITMIKRIIKKNNLQSNIKLLDRLSAQEMVDEMLKANVFIAPTSIENSSNAIGEAMMIGVPVVTTPVGGLTSFLEDNFNCLITPAGDEYLLAFQIKNFFDNKFLAEKISHNAYKTALKRHDIDKTTTQYLNIYNEIIQLHTLKETNKTI